MELKGVVVALVLTLQLTHTNAENSKYCTIYIVISLF